MDPLDTTERIDGRRARGERARTAVIDALLTLYEEGDFNPTAPRIARRAGVSLRLLYHHFADLEAMFAAVMERQTERIMTHFRLIPAELPLKERITTLCAQRARLLEAMTPVRRASLLQESTSPTIAGRLHAVRQMKRDQVEAVFATELDAAARSGGAEAHDNLRAALCMVTSWSAWDALRSQQGVDAPGAERTMHYTLSALLAPFMQAP